MHRYAALPGEGRTALSQQFYQEYRDDFLYAAGLDSRPLVVADRAVIEAAFIALGWTPQQQLMFVEGAPDGSITHKLRRELRKRPQRPGHAEAA
ncbi:hypothetical protein [Arthrobacter oryzae]|uniref:Uncharacterized protein n=1 Tax=Arthrobacter oryzae TaxID=409290 RepID=A0A495FM43_9MICC|nr:hypothetical protein [Arthrobacter oryzae]RKR30300.1 hypothetical protein C8D78_0625 [Arthrobacter oryzae]